MKSLQYQRTHRAIIEAFIKICNIKNFYDVTVQEIIDEALVSRFTFYKHFADKYEIAKLLENEICSSMEVFLTNIRTAIHKANVNDVNYEKNQNILIQNIKEKYMLAFNAIKIIRSDNIDIEERLKEKLKKQYYVTSKNNDDLNSKLYAAIKYELAIYFFEHQEIKESEYVSISHEACKKVFDSLEG